MKSNNKSTLFILLGAIAAGGAGWYLTQNYIKKEVSTHVSSFETEREAISVVVASVDLQVGEIISTQNAQIRNIPKVYVHKDAVSPQNYASALEGRQVKYAVRAGEPILGIHVSNLKVEGLASLLQPGQRAVTIPVDTLKTLSGFLKPGDNIDLYVTLKDGEKDRTAPLVQNLKILAAGTDIDDGVDDKKQNKYSEVTLAVSPIQATKVIHSQTVGELSVLLRRPEEKNTDFEDYATIDNLVEVKQAFTPPPAPPPPPPPMPLKKVGNGFELIRGGSKS